MTIGLNSVPDYEQGILFMNIISAFHHVIREERKPLSYLFVRICAVIGGTMSVIASAGGND